MDKKTILYVHFHKETREHAKRFYEDADFNVLLAKNTKECIKMFQAEKPDIVQLLHMIPEMDALDILIKIKNIDSDAKVVVLSADGDGTGDEMDIFMNAGACRYLYPPLTVDNMIHSVYVAANED